MWIDSRRSADPDRTTTQPNHAIGQVTYQRITVGLTRQKLDQFGLRDVDPVAVREMDAADQIANMQRLGAAVAMEQVKIEAFRNFFQASQAVGN